MVGGADVSFRPTPGRQLDANRSSLVRTTRLFRNSEGGRRNPGRATSVWPRTGLRRHIDEGGECWHSFRGRRGHGSIRLLDGWGFRTSNRCSGCVAGSKPISA